MTGAVVTTGLFGVSLATSQVVFLWYRIPMSFVYRS